MDKVLVTVIIPTKNAGPLFERVLKAVLGQKTPWKFEVLVIDSGSTDGTIDFIETIQKQNSNLRLKQIPPSEFNHGKTRNLGAAMANGDFVAYLTHDALPANDEWLKHLIEPLVQDSKVAGVFGRHLPYPEADPILVKELSDLFNRFAQFPRLKIEDRAKYDADQNYRQLLHFYSDNNSCLRKSVWEQIPYPEVNFAEDQIWAKLIVEAGFTKAYADRAKVFHSHSYSIRETFRRAYDESNALREIFGYRLCPHFYQVILRAGKKTLKDWWYLLTHAKISFIFITVPFFNIAKIFGYYCGANSWISRRFGASISLDQALKEGKIRGAKKTL